MPNLSTFVPGSYSMRNLRLPSLSLRGRLFHAQAYAKAVEERS